MVPFAAGSLLGDVPEGLNLEAHDPRQRTSVVVVVVLDDEVDVVVQVGRVVLVHEPQREATLVQHIIRVAFIVQPHRRGQVVQDPVDGVFVLARQVGGVRWGRRSNNMGGSGTRTRIFSANWLASAWVYSLRQRTLQNSLYLVYSS